VPHLSPVEILFVAVIALVVLGPEKLPGIARTVGHALNEARRMASEVRAEFESGMEIEDEEPPPPPSSPDEAQDDTLR
jgi:sec-independent protein translocase protein TatB